MYTVGNIQELIKELFPGTMGMQMIEINLDRVVASMVVRPDLCTVGNIIHGGAVMAFADTLGGIATLINIEKGRRTTTIESKTNFLRAVAVGTRLIGECTPLHRGKTTMVWQTVVSSASGEKYAIVIQTQFVHADES